MRLDTDLADEWHIQLKFTHICVIFDLCSVIAERLAGKVTMVMN